MDNKDAAEPQQDVNIELKTIEGAIARAIQPEVKVLDRIAQILEATNKNVEETKQIAINTKGIADDTKKGVRLTWITIFAGIFVAVILFVINIALQYFKIF